MKISSFATCCSLILITLPSLSAQAATPLKIAIPNAMSGPVTQYGDMLRYGALTAVEQLNAAGGALGRPIEAVLMDDVCEPKQAVNVANQVVSQGIRYVVGHSCSGGAIPASAIYEDEEVVYITPAATAPQLTDRQPYHYVFRSIGRDDQQGPVAVRYLLDHVKPKKVAVLHDKQSYGEGIARVVKAQLDAHRVPVVAYEGVQVGDSDYSAVISKLKALGVDFVYFGGYHPEMGLLLRQAREQSLQAQFMGAESAGNAQVSAIAGAASEGMLVTLPADFSSDPANAAVVRAFAEKKRPIDGAFQLTTYAAIKVIVDAINASQTDDTKVVAKYIHNNSFKTPIGELAFDPKGDLKAFKFAVFRWHQDGSKTPAP